MKSGRRTRPGIVGKLMLLSILVLMIPWFTRAFIFQYIEDRVLEAQQQALLLTTQAVAAALHGQYDLFAETGGMPFSGSDAQSCSLPFIKDSIHLDGEDGEWSSLSKEACLYRTDEHSPIFSVEAAPPLLGELRLGRRDRNLYAFLDVTDDTVIYRQQNHNSVATGDHLRIKVRAEDESIRRIVVVANNPGDISAYETRDDWRYAVGDGLHLQGIRGFWRETVGGYSIELQIPLNMLSSKEISFTVADKRRESADPAQYFFAFDTLPSSRDGFIQLVFLDNPEVERIIQGANLPGARISVIDDKHRVRTEDGDMSSQPASKLAERDAFVRKLPGDSGSAGRSEESITWAKFPVRSPPRTLGYVLIEQPNGHILSGVREKLKRGQQIVIAVCLGVAVIFWLFSSRLAWRIRRLSIQADAAIDGDGRVLADSIGAEESAGDEIGDLSRTISGLLSRLTRHEEFLRRVPRTLRHELSNPLNTVSTSIQVLTAEHPDLADSKYVHSAERGVERISEIVETFADAATLEEALLDDEQENVDLTHLLENYVNNIAASFPSHRLSVLAANSPVIVSGSGFRIEQILDKLIDNAVEFAPDNGRIVFEIVKQGELHALLSVSNDGPLIPKHALQHVFDSMYSTGSNGQPHLGMGLYIVRLIVEHMRGSVVAKNRDDGCGVTFVVSLPLADESSSRSS